MDTGLLESVKYGGLQNSLRKQKSNTLFEIQKHISKFENTFNQCVYLTFFYRSELCGPP